MQLSVLPASFAVTMVSVFLPLSGAMDTLDVVMAVMREDVVSGQYYITVGVSGYSA